MNVAGSSLLYTRFDFETACRRLADLGFETVDVATIEQWAHLDPSTVVDSVEETAGRIEAACENAGLEPVAFNAGPGDASIEEQARRMEALAQVGEMVGVDVATVGPAATDSPLEDDLDRFRALVDAVDTYEFSIAVEGHQNLHTEDPEVALEYVESIPDLQITLDPGHYAVGQYWNDGDGYDPLLPHVAHVHLRQARPGKIQVVEGDGIIDFADVFSKLRSVGYDGTATVEYVDSLADKDIETVADRAASVRETGEALLEENQ